MHPSLPCCHREGTVSPSRGGGQSNRHCGCTMGLSRLRRSRDRHPRPPVSAKRTIPWLAALLAAALAAPAGADGPRHELSATSKAVIEIGADGTVIMHATNVRLV